MGVSVWKFYILGSVNRPVSGGLKSVSIVEYYLKSQAFVKLCKLKLRLLLVKFRCI
jgi:hypothetical protein